MSDELLLPQVPEPKPEDPEDVSWALSTAEAMWARGDHSEGVKWVRRAAEAAADAENDERSLELAKAAADLAGLVSKRGASRASIHLDDGELAEETPPPPPPPPPKPQASLKPAPAAPKAAPKAPGAKVGTPSRPPAPLPSKTSQPPPAMGGRPSTPAKPFGTNTAPKSIPPPKAAASAPKADEKKAPRKSKANLEQEAKAAFAIPTPAAAFPAPAPDTSPDPIGESTQETPVVRPLGGNDPTIVGNVNDIMAKAGEPKRPSPSEIEDRTADEWDASPTQNLTGDELHNLPIPDSSRKTSLALPKPDFKSTVTAFTKPKASEKVPASAPSARSESHDPSIVTTQAVRVVVWRDGNGVHVAPQGTVVSAITVDAVLVALDSNADLTAWLTQKGR
jgi:hypothetical protein